MWKTIVEPGFGDTDGLQHINNNVIGKWFELGRNDLFKIFTPDLKISFDDWKLIMVHSDYDFIDMVYYGSDVEIRTFILKIGNSSFTVGSELWQNNKLKAKVVVF